MPIKWEDIQIDCMLTFVFSFTLTIGQFMMFPSYSASSSPSASKSSLAMSNERFNRIGATEKLWVGIGRTAADDAGGEIIFGNGAE
jgi:hypothetical protein